MPLQWSIYAVLSAVACVIAIGLAAIAWDHRDQPTAVPFLALMVAIAGWTGSSAVKLAFADDFLQVLFMRMGALFAIAIPPIWVVLTARYAEYDWFLQPRVLATLVLAAIGSGLLVLTNPLHGLVWEGVAVVSTSPRILTYEPARLNWVTIAIAYAQLGVGIAILVSVYVRASRVHRRQAGMLLLGTLVPFLANGLFNVGASPVQGIDLTPVTFTLTGVVFALALFRYSLLDYTPVAYRNVTDVLGDGVIVLDPDDHIREFNENAERILDTSLSVGEPLNGRIPETDTGGVSGDVLEVEVDEHRRYFAVRTSELPGRGGPTGRVIALRDVTPLKEQEQRLEVTNRVLRHNLRNEINVIMGLADTVQEQLDEEEPGLQRIVQRAGALSEVGDKARQIQQTMRRSEDEVGSVDVVPVARSVVETYREQRPAADVSLTGLDRAPVVAPEPDLLETAISNLVENALDHHDRDDPTVTVEIREDGDDVLVRVLDDGPGIPDAEIAVLDAGGETPLEHGSGLGLWLVYWSVRAVGGEVSFEDREPRGTAVTLAFQAGS